MSPQPDRPGTPWLDAKEVKRRVSFSAVLESYGVLAKLRGRGDQLTGHAPYREDTHASFSVNLGRGVWNDLAGRPSSVDGRGEVSGDVIGFVQAMENCSFRDALLKLQREFIGEPGGAGEGTTPAASATQETRGRAQEVLRQAATSPTENVPFGKELGGLRTDVPFLTVDHALSEATIKAFGVGYCTRGMMKGRIVYPIRRPDGTIVAYAGRAVTPAMEEAEGKYKFPSGFKKSLELFGIEKLVSDPEIAKKVAEHGITVVEGFHDVMALYQHGYASVAIMGSDGPHPAQRAMLLDPKINPSRKVTLFFDNNEAGIEAKKRYAKDLIRDAHVRVIEYARVPEGSRVKEPCEPEHFTGDELRVLFKTNS